jgi:class 3 adenylate cyclase/predicted alpha/beta hydrolase
LNRPDTKYAKSGNIRIAYQVTGEGPIDMVWAPGTVSHLDLSWESRESAHGVERWSSFCRLIRFDKRGTGMSDRPTEAATLEERIDDIRAVMDDAGSKEAVIFGGSEGGSMACMFAATYPHRTRALVLWGVQARWVKTEDYPWGQTREEMERGIEELAEKGVTVDYLKGWGAGLPKNIDPASLEAYLRFFRAGASPSALVALERMNAEIDIRSILPTIRVPTLVMNRTGDPLANIAAARDLASRIPNAKFVEFPGNTHQMTDIRDSVIAEIEEFITGVRPSPIPKRILSTILFLDIVDSTKHLSRLGDNAWKEILANHNELVRGELDRFQGEEIKTTGDGFLATFDGPTRAIQCARSIRDSVRSLGIDLRVGIHTGECELTDGDVGGIAVHTAARVAAGAKPGEVLVSSTVKDLVAGAGLEFEDAGTHSLKGVPGKWRLYRAL